MVTGTMAVPIGRTVQKLALLPITTPQESSLRGGYEVNPGRDTAGRCITLLAPGHRRPVHDALPPPLCSAVSATPTQTTSRRGRTRLYSLRSCKIS
ncbi:hypothetical protein EVAR_19357_1 [Eumeta japonica]|uniref:Uncharacterized protein n=1 Tax=Eumeta variegata TaxID=151549 RepID=A0A4C1TRG2_EUMVA|nr:hypothetical protein EVAR_19357_1 [Eumeta japonica]